MSNFGPVDAFLIIGGNDLTSDTFELSEEVENMLEEVRPFGEEWDKCLPIGVGKVVLTSGGGLYDDRQKAIIAGLQTKVGVQQLAAYGLESDAIGAECVLLNGPIVSKFNRVADLGELTKANPEYVVTDAHRRGMVVHGRTDETGDFDTESTPADQATAPRLRAIAIVSSFLLGGSPVLTEITTATAHGLTTGQTVLISGHTSSPSINGHYPVTVTGPTTFTIEATTGAGSPGGTGGSFVVTSSQGGFADLHVTELDLGGHTGLDLDLIHSADGITFAPVLSFATVTAVAATHAQRVSTSSQIERYTAIDGDFTGAGSPVAKPFVGLHRNA